MKYFRFAVGPLLLILTACGAGGVRSSTSGPLPVTGAATLGSMTQNIGLSEADDDARQGPQPVYKSSAADRLYVGNERSNSITVYRYDASGNTAPLKEIAGSKTGINHPGQLSEDAAGNLYVANGSGPFDSGGEPSILVFAHGASGNVAPIRKLAGPLTGFHSISAMTVDQLTGKIFVVDDLGSEGLGADLLRFPPNANGNEAPYAKAAIPSGADSWGIQLASDSTGKNIIDAHEFGCCLVSTAGVATLAKQFANGVPPVVAYSTNTLGLNGVADDPTTKTYLASSYFRGGIYRFAEDTVGKGPDDGTPAHFKPAVISTITSDTCGGQLAIGYLRSIYVTHQNCPKDAVYVYEHDARGKASPLRVLSGTATKLSEPYGIYEGQ